MSRRWRIGPTSCLAGATFAEKAGCYVNADGRLQYSEAALPPRDGSLPDLDLLAILLHRPGGGPVESSTVLAELAERIPAFAVAKGGKLPAHGVLLGGGAAGRRPRRGGAELHRHLVPRPRRGPRAMSETTRRAAVRHVPRHRVRSRVRQGLSRCFC